MTPEHFKLPALILMALSAFFFPFWLTAIIFVLGVYFFDTFYLGLLILFFMDAIYGFETFSMGPIYGMLTIVGILAYLAIGVIKDRTVNLR